jgi:hypothetical protein
MSSLEKNGPILFVKPFASADALEIGSCLNAQEAYVLERVYPDYSVTCLNKDGKLNKQHLGQFKTESALFQEIVLMGKQCADLLRVDYIEWSKTLYRAGDENLAFVWCTPAFGKIISSPKNLKRFRSIVEEISEKI